MFITAIFQGFYRGATGMLKEVTGMIQGCSRGGTSSLHGNVKAKLSSIIEVQQGLGSSSHRTNNLYSLCTDGPCLHK